MSVIGLLDDTVQLLEQAEDKLSAALAEARQPGEKSAPLPQLYERLDRVRRAVLRELVKREA